MAAAMQLADIAAAWQCNAGGIPDARGPAAPTSAEAEAVAGR